MPKTYKDIPLNVYPDFPKKGVLFLDVFPLLNKGILDNLSDDLGITEPLLMFPEARSFCFFGALKKKDNYIIPLRKFGKLPGPLQEVSYQKEYGSDTLHFSKDHIRDAVACLGQAGVLKKYEKDRVIPICLVDDVLATGGTASSVVEVLNSFKLDDCPYTFKVVKAAFLIEIPFLKGRQLLENEYGVEVSSLIESE